MPKKSKKFIEASQKIDAFNRYELAEAVALLKSTIYTKFVPSVEIAIKTNANPKYNDQMIRATVVLPHGTGKSVRVAAFVAEDIKADVTKAGADVVGNDELLKKIEKGEMDFDVLVTSPDMMRDLAKVAKLLGPKGLMPSPKAGTVSANVAQAVEEIKKGKVEFRLDKTGNIHGIVGKANFDDKQLIENITAFIDAIKANKPTGVKGQLFKKVVIAPTMGPGIQLTF